MTLTLIGGIWSGTYIKIVRMYAVDIGPYSASEILNFF